jgi:hypothetical protein
MFTWFYRLSYIFYASSFYSCWIVHSLFILHIDMIIEKQVVLRNLSNAGFSNLNLDIYNFRDKIV